ncbi:MAG TPA: hypothetical protein VGF94_26535 [Kofleriaceae bacterium]
MIARAVGLALIALVAACGGGGGFPDAHPFQDAALPGTFRLDWSLQDSSMAPVTCTDAMATEVLVIVRNDVTNDTFSQPFDCTPLTSISGPLPIGSYDMHMTLQGTSGMITQVPDQDSVIIKSQMTTTLTAVVFTVP